MANGIFHVDFRSSTGDYGDGLVVVKDGFANGGDANFLYQGSVPHATGPFETTFKVSKWRAGNTNVVGIDNYTLNARGRVDYEAGTIEMEGKVAEAPTLSIKLTGKKIAAAV